MDMKPCPHCGGKGRCERYHPTANIDTYTPGCDFCGFWMYPQTWDESWTEEQAIEIWNRRAQE